MKYCYNLLYENLEKVIPQTPLFAEDGIPQSVMAVLTDWDVSPADVALRRDVLADFRKFPFLCDRLGDLSQRAALLRDATAALEGGGEELQSALAALQQTARVCLEHIRFIRQLKSVFDAAPVQSRSLKGLEEGFLALSAAPELDSLWHGLSTLPMLSANSLRLDFELDLRPDGSLEHAGIAALSTSVAPKESPLKKLFNRKKETVLDLQFDSRAVQDLSCTALQELQCRLARFCGVMDNYFTPLGQQIAFYRFALDYEKAVNQANIPLCVPVLEDADAHVFFAGKLYDFTEIATDPEPVCFGVSADCTKSVFLAADTKNGASYLRCVTWMQLLGNAGLCACGENIRLSRGHKLLILRPEGEDVDACNKALSEQIRAADSHTVAVLHHPFRGMSVYDSIRAFYCHIQLFCRSDYHVFATTDLARVLSDAPRWNLPKAVEICPEAVLSSDKDIGKLYGFTFEEEF